MPSSYTKYLSTCWCACRSQNSSWHNWVSYLEGQIDSGGQAASLQKVLCSTFSLWWVRTTYTNSKQRRINLHNWHKHTPPTNVWRRFEYFHHLCPARSSTTTKRTAAGIRLSLRMCKVDVMDVNAATLDQSAPATKTRKHIAHISMFYSDMLYSDADCLQNFRVWSSKTALQFQRSPTKNVFLRPSIS